MRPEYSPKITWHLPFGWGKDDYDDVMFISLVTMKEVKNVSEKYRNGNQRQYGTPKSRPSLTVTPVSSRVVPSFRFDERGHIIITQQKRTRERVTRTAQCHSRRSRWRWYEYALRYGRSISCGLAHIGQPPLALQCESCIRYQEKCDQFLHRIVTVKMTFKTAHHVDTKSSCILIEQSQCSGRENYINGENPLPIGNQTDFIALYLNPDVTATHVKVQYFLYQVPRLTELCTPSLFMIQISEIRIGICIDTDLNVYGALIYTVLRKSSDFNHSTTLYQLQARKAMVGSCINSYIQLLSRNSYKRSLKRIARNGYFKCSAFTERLHLIASSEAV
ncbi:hypothetical protein ANN_23646 [Periplaneta americana]|uniref:Uncharacterized protein n=1 Tax=Periplaneta americana TaxID=6978 RepID=A0ABQ8SLQ3_PERAM|nr:hypothetical protein ANN_23646 [Periplaneta americana]